MEWVLLKFFKVLKHMLLVNVQALNIASVWASVVIDKTCLYYCIRVPQHIIGCGHSVCNCCVESFRELVKGYESCFALATCIVCKRQASLIVSLKPQMCRVCILLIDRGGIRGVIPLEFLLYL